jgi:hypothetical protein
MVSFMLCMVQTVNDNERCDQVADVEQVDCPEQCADPLQTAQMDIPSDVCLQQALQPDRHACIQRLFQTVWEGILRLQ